MIIVPSVSHLDHSLAQPVIDFIAKKYADVHSFKIDTFELPKGLGLPSVLCGLYGPLMGDPFVDEKDVFYKVRGSRKCASRLVNRPMREDRRVTVIMGTAQGHDDAVLYTAFGGPLAPREPGDVTLGTWDDVQESRVFWSRHALVAE